MLTKIFFRLHILGALLGTAYQGYHTMFIRVPFSELSKPYGLMWMLGFGTFWFLIWSITPSEWWDGDI